MFTFTFFKAKCIFLNLDPIILEVCEKKKGKSHYYKFLASLFKYHGEISKDRKINVSTSKLSLQLIL